QVTQISRQGMRSSGEIRGFFVLRKSPIGMMPCPAIDVSLRPAQGFSLGFSASFPNLQCKRGTFEKAAMYSSVKKVERDLYNSLCARPQPISVKQVPSVKQDSRHADTIPRVHEIHRHVLRRGPAVGRDGPPASYGW